ncbi:hypothetical protein [Microbacterium sp. AR7-10]|uniref:hypothetical protein n=1 Tax=Microbacterium sp. AR7-10 TaxID=1891970 RepID=UPI0008FCCF58|nr:hypothetical protein [Microbacterium sp. AR7-10]OIU88665.1 hypothetical protein BFN01_04270 [Microbacterium sp. AR7-10]
MSNGPWSTVIWDAQSGDRLETVEASSGAWQRGGVTDQTHTFPNPGLSKADVHDLFGKDRPRDRVLAHCWNGTPVYHGLILDSDYHPAKGMLDVIHCDLRELASARWLFGIGASTQTFQWTGKSWRGIASRIAKIIFTDPISPAWPLPVTIPADEAGSQSFKTDGYEFRSGESLLSEIEEMPGGPDLDFHPRITGDKFGWDLRIGTPHLSGPTFELNLQAAKSPLTEVGVKTIGRDKITGVHGIGDGSEWDMVRGGAAAPVSAGLARDTKLTVKNASLTDLNRRAEGFLATRVTTSQQWSFNVKTNAVDEGGIDPAQLRIGSIIRIESRGDWWIDDGWTEHRVLAFSGTLDDPHTITLTVETI